MSADTTASVLFVILSVVAVAAAAAAFKSHLHRHISTEGAEIGRSKLEQISMSDLGPYLFHEAALSSSTRSCIWLRCYQGANILGNQQRMIKPGEKEKVWKRQESSRHACEDGSLMQGLQSCGVL